MMEVDQVSFSRDAIFLGIIYLTPSPCAGCYNAKAPPMGGLRENDMPSRSEMARETWERVFALVAREMPDLDVATLIDAFKYGRIGMERSVLSRQKLGDCPPPDWSEFRFDE